MTELSGKLGGVGLPAIIRFLTGLEKTGALKVVHGDWQGAVFFEAGLVVGASLGPRRGLAALDAIVLAMPGGDFNFDVVSRLHSQADIELSTEALHRHLDDLLRGVDSRSVQLPSLDGIPDVIVQDEPGVPAQPVPLDRVMLLTLLAVDGVRTVREIVAHRGTIDTLWQLGDLAEAGLVRVRPGAADLPGTTDVPDAFDVHAPPVAAVEPPARWPVVLEPELEVVAGHCPKLGFEDDPGNSFGRPTRLHRCYAAGTPLPLSLDQQRELCLTNQFGTCPRLPAVDGALRGDRSRIVRLPFGGRNGSSPRANRPVSGASEPTQFRAPTTAAREGVAARPTPFRARGQRSQATPAAGPAAAPLELEPVGDERWPVQRALIDDVAGGRISRINDVAGSRLSRIKGVPLAAIAGLGIVVAVLALIGYVLFPSVNELFSDDSLDSSLLPNTRAVAAGEPVSQVLTPRASPVARSTPAIAAAPATSASAPNGAGTTDPTSGAAGAAGANPNTTGGAVGAGPNAAAGGAVGAGPNAAAGGAVEPTLVSVAPSAPSPVVPRAAGTLLDDGFTSNALNWPSSPQGTAWVAAGGYRLIPRQAKQFVAVGAPLLDVPRDVIVSATFRKLAGPPGGGYGIILRDQGGSARDGVNQDGYFYVLEAGDKGEFGIWFREGDHWVDLMPWQHTDAIHQDTGTNQLTVSAIGDRLSLSINGSQVATHTDATLGSGSVGLFVGGDDNQVVVEHFAVQTP
jgi:hypothetical protein